MGTFLDKLRCANAAGLYSCAGFDPDEKKMPSHLLERRHDDTLEAWRKFLYDLTIEASAHAAAFKPNWAFFLKRGHRGLHLLEDLCRVVRVSAPNALLILDMKVGDIGNTNHGYVEFAFKICGADAVTVHPYMGSKAMMPFLENLDKGIFVLCKTSNQGADEFQDMMNVDTQPFYMGVASKVSRIWNTNGNCGLVTGATYPDELRRIRKIVPELPLLIPGIGAQGGDLEKTIRAVATAKDHSPFVINQSSSFMYASKGDDFAKAGAAVLADTNAKVVSILRAE